MTADNQEIDLVDGGTYDLSQYQGPYNFKPVFIGALKNLVESFKWGGTLGSRRSYSPFHMWNVPNSLSDGSELITGIANTDSGNSGYNFAPLVINVTFTNA